MGSIITLDNLDTLEENPYSDYPCLRHMYTAQGADYTNNTLADQAGSAHISLTGLAEVSAGVSYALTNSSAQSALDSGVFDQPATKSVIMLTLADLDVTASGILKLGNAVTSGGGMNQVGSVPVTRAGNDTSFASVTPTYGAAVELHATIFTPNTKLQAMRLQTNGTFAVNNGVADTTAVPASIDFDPSVLIEIDEMVATCLIFLEDTPSDGFMESMMRWIMPKWEVGNVVMYPGLKGRS